MFTSRCAVALGFCLALVAAAPVRAELPAKLKIGETTLVLNGAGSRTKYLMKMYEAGLYLTEPSHDAAAIIDANNAMVIRLEITSGLVTQEKLLESLNEGFENATGGNTAPLKGQIETFRKCFAGEIAKGDVFDLVHVPAQGVVVLKNGKRAGVVQGLAFKQALFGIWLSNKPADEDLKAALLDQ